VSPQHDSLTTARWSQFSLDQQILMIANEMNRAKKSLAAKDARRLENCYERVLALTDLTIQTSTKSTLGGELLRWRDLVAGLYVAAGATVPHARDHEALFKCLLLFTAEASKQRPFVLTQNK
jgi:hypothetical protein